MNTIKLKLREDRPATIDEHRALRDRISKLQNALKPFAEISLWRDRFPDAKSDILTAQQLQGYIKVEDVRAARAALADIDG